MDKSIDKMYRFLLDAFSKVNIFNINKVDVGIKESKDVEKLQCEIVNLARLLKTSSEETSINEVFLDFSTLCYYLEIANLNTRDMYNIIVHFINRNLKSGILSDAPSYDLKKIQKRQFKSASTDEIVELFMSGKIYDLLGENYEPNEREKCILCELIERQEELSTNISHERVAHDEFKTCVIDKFPNVNMEDIARGVKALEVLNISENVINSIKNYLLSYYKKNYNFQEENYDINAFDAYLSLLGLENEEYREYHELFIDKNTEKKNDTVKAVSSETKKYLTEKDVKDINKRIRAFYNLYKRELIKMPNFNEFKIILDDMIKLEADNTQIMMFIHNILCQIINVDDYFQTYDELIEFVSISIKYGADTQFIYMLLKNNINLKKHIDNPIAEYYDKYDELSFYDETGIKDLDSLVSNIFITNDEDYTAIKDIISEYLSSHKTSKVDYEYSLAKSKIR